MARRVEAVVVAVASIVGLLAAAGVVLRNTQVTAGWTDQSHYHMPTIVGLAQALPEVDVVGVQTATGPLYHLTLAIPMRVLGLSEGQVQVLGGWFYWTLLVVAVVWVTRPLPVLPRALVGAAVVASPYVWQSTLWTTTDAAGTVFALLALALSARRVGSLGWAAATGIAIALAVATRQTYAWLLLPGLVAAWHADDRRWRTVLAVCGPAVAVLSVLVAAWGGLTPPAFADLNGAGPNPAGISFGFALWAFFAVPLLAALWRRRPRVSRSELALAALVGTVAALPALAFPSDYSEERNVRKGGWLWLVVRETGEVADRSVVVIVLAFVGAAAVTLILRELARAGGPVGVLGSACFASIIAAAASAQTYQKYYEAPILICFAVLAVALLARARGWTGKPLVVPTAIQVLSLAAAVGAPVLASL